MRMLIKVIPLIIAAVALALIAFTYLDVPKFGLGSYATTALLAYVVVKEIRLFNANGGFTGKVKGVFL